MCTELQNKGLRTNSWIKYNGGSIERDSSTFFTYQSLGYKANRLILMDRQDIIFG
jgi:hypothetical protein